MAAGNTEDFFPEHVFPDQFACDENERDILSRLPFWLRDNLVLRSKVWGFYPSESCSETSAQPPLFIANLPVVIPPAVWEPLFPPSQGIMKPQDPLKETLDPTMPITDEHARLLWRLFRTAEGFLHLFDGELLVMLRDELECLRIYPRCPNRFGGLRIFFTFGCGPCPSSQPHSSPPVDSDVGGNPSALVPEPMPLERPLRFIDVRKMDAPESAAPLAYNTLLRLTTPAPPFQAEGGVAHARGHTLPSTLGTTIGEAILKLSVQKESVDAIRKDSIEETITASESSKVEPDQKTPSTAATLQFSRSLLWRTAGKPEQVWGWSGAPIEVFETGEVIGFQNWEWGRVCQAGLTCWNATVPVDGMLELDEDAETTLFPDARYPVYGSYPLSTGVLEMEIYILESTRSNGDRNAR